MLPLVIAGAITGVVAIILGGVLGFKVLPDITEDKLKDNVRLELSEIYRNWETPPYDVTTKIYFFDVKNAGGIAAGQNASVEERGPIIYKQTRRKDKIIYDATSDTFTYDELVSFELDPSSTIKETDSFVTLNVLKYMSLMYVEGTNLMELVKGDFQSVFADTDNDGLFHRIKIENLLFKGYEMGLTENLGSTGAVTLRNVILEKLNENPRFKKSATSSGYNFFVFKPEQTYKENTYEMYGGAKDIYKQGQLKTINAAEHINVWPKLDDDNYCNSIRGTDSHTFNPDLDVDEGLSVYNNDLCRSLDYAFTEEVDLKEIDGNRLILKSENFQYTPENGVNKCFCIEDENNCANTGFLNLYNCLNGIPLISSQPHFLYTDPENAERLQFSPVIEKDVSYIDIQSNSGAVLRVSKKTQYNIWLRKVTGFAEEIVPFMMPLFWVEESMEIPDVTVDYLNDAYFDDLVMIEGVKWGLLGVGVVLLLGSVGTFVLSKLNLNNKS